MGWNQMRHLSCKQTRFSCTPSTQPQHWLASQALATPEQYSHDLKGKMINDLIVADFPPWPPLPWVVEQEPHSKALALKIVEIPDFWGHFPISGHNFVVLFSMGVGELLHFRRERWTLLSRRSAQLSRRKYDNHWDAVKCLTKIMTATASNEC